MSEFLFLSRNPAKCAQLIKKGELCEKIRTYKDILCAAYWIVKPKRAKRLGLPKLICKSESKKQIVHWIAQSFMHFEFVINVALAACEQYTLSGAETWHPSEFALLNIEENMPPRSFFHHDYWEDPPQQFPHRFHTTDAVEGYRRWYNSLTTKKRENANSTKFVAKRRKLTTVANSNGSNTFQQELSQHSLRVS